MPETKRKSNRFKHLGAKPLGPVRRNEANFPRSPRDGTKPILPAGFPSRLFQTRRAAPTLPLGWSGPAFRCRWPGGGGAHPAEGPMRAAIQGRSWGRAARKRRSRRVNQAEPAGGGTDEDGVEGHLVEAVEGVVEGGAGELGRQQLDPVRERRCDRGRLPADHEHARPPGTRVASKPGRRHDIGRGPGRIVDRGKPRAAKGLGFLEPAAVTRHEADDRRGGRRPRWCRAGGSSAGRR